MNIPPCYNYPMIKEYLTYLKDNPKGYWFKAKLYGWGWVPVKWQGWLVIAVATAIALLGIRIGDADDSPGAGALGIILGISFLLYFCYTKGEKPRWQWGPPKDKK